MEKLEQQLIRLLTDSRYDTNIRKSGIYRFPSNYRFETHAHEEYEINYINAGTCIMEVDGSRRKIASNLYKCKGNLP